MSNHHANNKTTAEAYLLRARALVKIFRMGDAALHVLKNVDLNVKPGEFLAIEGRSGSGKSTLLHILGALESTDNGSIEFDGQNYTRYTRAGSNRFTDLLTSRMIVAAIWLSLLAALVVFVTGFLLSSTNTMWTAAGLGALFFVLLISFFGTKFVLFLLNFGREQLTARLRNKAFGFVFQFYHLLPELNVLENTLLGSMIEHPWLKYGTQRRGLTERATKLLDELGMSHRLKHRPAQLSGGERQRVAIARALMNNPRVLFADEPTGNLDSETGKQIMGVLEKLHREHGQTIVMVTHDRAIAHRADRILVLKDGKLAAPSEPAGPKAAVTTLEYQ